MKSSIRITIKRDGNTLDDAEVELADLPDGTAVVDALAAAFADRDGLFSWPNPAFDADQPEHAETNPSRLTVTPYRNISYRLREFATAVVSAYNIKQKAAVATAAALKEVADIGITVVEHKE